MEKVFMGRGKGKTSKLIELSSKNNIPIGVFSINWAKIIKQKAFDMGIKIPEPIILSNKTTFRSQNIEGVYVDNAEFMLQTLFESYYGVMLKGFSMSTDD